MTGRVDDGGSRADPASVDDGEHAERRPLGVLADPELAPVEVGHHLADALPTALATQLGDDQVRQVQVSYERLPAGSTGGAGLLGHAAHRKGSWGVDLVICITDCPLRTGRQPIVADLDTRRGVAVISLPALGGMRLRRRVTDLAVQIVADLTHSDAAVPAQPYPRARPHPRLPVLQRLTRQFHRITPENDQFDLRIVASRGRLRLLIGMVRDNRPWQLASGLSRAVIGAAAIAAFFLINTAVWTLADALNPVRLAVATAASLTVLVIWLIVNHGMWDPPKRQPPGHEREQAVLYNASTIITLTVGVACLYATVFAALLVTALLLIDADVLANHLHAAPTFAAYVKIAWLTASAATIGGALGSSLDSDRAVRSAAYSYRERQRHAQQHD